MALVTSEEMLLDAQKRHYAVGAFNAENMEMVMAIVTAAEELHAPVMIQTTSGTLKYADPLMFFHMVSAAAAEVHVPVCLHLDHGPSFEMAVKCVRAGYTSVMIDGSKLPFEENIALSSKVVEMAHAAGVPVEAELGKVGGKEDDTTSGVGDIYTDPQEAKEFVERTGINSLAVGIGTSHGFYKGTPVLDINRLSEIREVVDIPLVLHGASGLTDEQVISCVERGICKVNFATELRKAYTDAVKEYIKGDTGVFDPKKYQAKGREAVIEQVKYRIKVCGADGKA
ncbi:MAG: class II fructose-bisphosphate aldolase [Eubacteriales bacterium]|jgi:tagatose 1,6-diphosphate aldolase GatY/KbaY